MSGSSRRRVSKWDHKDSEALPEDFRDRAPPRKPREPLSPSRGSRRHEGRSRERMVTWDRDENSTRMSPDLDEWRHRHHSRSPRNGLGRSYRSRSRSRSRSQSPVYNSRREPALSEKSRSKSGFSAQKCRDFAAGNCRRGNHCQFLHEDAQIYDSGRPLGSRSPDGWESRHRRSGGSRYSPDDTKDYVVRNERSINACSDFVKGNCRRGASCRYAHHDAAADVFERGPVDDVFRDRDNDHRSRHTYSDRNHDREPPKRGETLCKFFAAGNCRNGNRCRFSHQIQEDFSPERRPQDDRRGPDRKFEGSPGWEGPRWSDSNRLDVPTDQGWGEDKNENMEVAKEATPVRSRDDSWSRGMTDMKQTWNVPASIDEPKTRDEGQPLQWKSESSVPGMGLSASKGTDNPGVSLSVSRGPESFPGDMELSPRDIYKQHDLSSSKSQISSLSNISFPVGQRDTAGEASNEKHYAAGFQEQKVFNDPYSGRNPNFKEDKPYMYPGEGRNVIGNSDSSCITPNPSMNVQPAQGVFQSDQRVIRNSDGSRITSTPPMNVQQGQSIFQSDQRAIGNSDGSCITPDPNFKKDKPYAYPGESRNVTGSSDGSCITPNPPLNIQPGQSVFENDQRFNVQPMSSINLPGQGQLPFPFHPSVGDGMQLSSPNPPMNVPPTQSVLQSDQRVIVQPISSSMNPPPGQSQLPFGANGMQTSHNPSSFLDSNVADGPHLTNVSASGLASATAANHNSASKEQLLSDLSASLAQLIESRQQLPQLSSAATPNGMANLPDSAAFMPPVSGATTVQPYQAPETLNHYDPICDSIEPKMPKLGNQPMPSRVEQKSSDNELPRESGNVNQHVAVAASKDDENGKKTAEGRNKAPENGPSEDMAADDGADDGKKSKDAKGIRPFKFALAEFVKELLKPSWKDGHVSKDAYKAIVKKVVDKVIDTQGLQIPQTKEKIDQYLSCSKPKLEKLVQAYVGKFQKS